MPMWPILGLPAFGPNTIIKITSWNKEIKGKEGKAGEGKD